MNLTDIDYDALKAQTETLGIVLQRETEGGDVRRDLEGLWHMCHALLDAHWHAQEKR
jgi:hypothetical protein